LSDGRKIERWGALPALKSQDFHHGKLYNYYSTMNLRTDEKGDAIKEGSQVGIGGNERYVAMCRKHFREAMR
jgi:hypothetical protein